MTRETISQLVRDVLKEAISRSQPPATPSGGEKPVPGTCRAMVLAAPKILELREFPIREIGDDEILVKVEGCGICGTDVHEYKSDPMKLAPLVLGHEGTGEIVRLGKNVTRDNGGKTVRVGDKIVTSVKTCGTCDACQLA